MLLAESLERVHTHTHTHTISLKKIKMEIEKIVIKACRNTGFCCYLFLIN